MNWPTNLSRATGNIWKHEEPVALWCEHPTPDIEMMLLWRGPAWAVPDTLGGQFIERFFAAEEAVNGKYLNMVLKISDPQIVESNHHEWMKQSMEFDKKIIGEGSKEC